MEMTISQLCSRVKLPISSSSSLFCSYGNSKRNSLNGAVSVNSIKEIDHFNNISYTAKRKLRSHAPVVRTARASVDENQSPTSGATRERWLLQPVGNGDTRHIGYKVEMPAPFEISSGQVTIGRLPEKADVVIPVATVSGVHATIDTKGDNLLVTDMNSTNGTFIEDKRLTPGVAAPAFPGTRITFGESVHYKKTWAYPTDNPVGCHRICPVFVTRMDRSCDTNLAIFRVFKLEDSEEESTKTPTT